MEEGHVTKTDLMEDDRELDEIRVCLLPERFFSFAEQAIQQVGDPASHRITIKFVLKRVVSPFRTQTDGDIVGFPSVVFQNLLHLCAEIAFDFENDAAQTFMGNFCFVPKKLLREGVHGACRFSRPGCADDDGASEQSARGNGQPVRVLRSDELAWIVDFADNNVKLVSCLNGWVRRQRMWLSSSLGLQRENIKRGEQERKADVGGCEQHDVVRGFQPGVRPRVSKCDQPKKVLVPSLRSQRGGHWPGSFYRQPGACPQRQQYREEILRAEDALDHAALDAGLMVDFAVCGAAGLPSCFSGVVGSFLASHSLNSLSRRNRRLRDSPIMYSWVAPPRKAASRSSIVCASSSSRTETTFF